MKAGAELLCWTRVNNSKSLFGNKYWSDKLWRNHIGMPVLDGVADWIALSSINKNLHDHHASHSPLTA